MIKITLKLKVLISLILFIFVFLGIIIFVSQKIILVSFLELENKEALKSIERTKTVFDKQVFNLDSRLTDWAVWDDTYYFIQDKNQEYIDSNLTDESLHNLGVNAMFFVSSAGAILYEKQINIDTKQKTFVSKDLKNTVLKSKKIISFTDIKDKHSGVIRDSSGLVLFASRPILRSNGEGPIAGTLVFIRYYDKQIKEYLENVNNNNEVDILRHDLDLPKRYVQANTNLDTGNKYYAYPLSTDTVAGFTSLYDFNNKPAYILENELPRSIYKQGIATVANFLYFIVLLCVSGVGFVLILINKFVISKITKLNKDVSLVKDPNNPKNKLDVKGNDEFANLAISINQMLDGITKSEEDLKKTDEELKLEKASLDQKVEELEKFQKLTIGRELKMIEMKKALRQAQDEKLKGEKSYIV